MKKIIFPLSILFLFVSCQSALSNSTDSFQIHCEVYYQTSLDTDGQAQSSTSIFELTAEDGEYIENFSDTSVTAHYLDDEYEGRTLQIIISDTTSGRQLVSNLYQFQNNLVPTNEFSGGHGFTGLSYVYHPQKPSEIQYFCRVAE
jgi:hypothetical protein